MPGRTDPFAPDDLTQDLRGRSVRGFATTASAQVLRLMISVAASAALGRLLHPDDFGLVAMVMAVSAVLDRIRHLGLGAPTVQRASITHEQVSVLFWINVIGGGVLTLLFAALAPGIAWFYGQSQLTPIAAALSVTFLLSGVTVQHEALLRRTMRFRQLAVVDVLSELLGVGAGITAAALGAQYWALVILNVAIVAARMGLMTMATRWRPGRLRRGTGVRPMLRFGGQVSVSSLLMSLAQRSDRILIGKFLTAETLGYYSRSLTLLHIPVMRFQASLRSVVVPGLSRIQDDPSRYRYYYRQAVQLVGAAGIPAALFALAAPGPIVLAILGPKWPDAVPILRALAPAGLALLLAPVTGWVYFSLGRGGRLMRWSLFESILTAGGFAVGLQLGGALGVALAFSIVRLSLWPIALTYCFAGTFVRIRDVSDVLWRPVTAGALAAAVTFLAEQFWMQPWLPIWALLACAALFTAVYGITIVLLPGGAQIIREMLSLSRELRSNGAAGQKNDDA